jgi:hypothetical protein
MKLKNQKSEVRSQKSGVRSWIGKCMFIFFLIISFAVVGCTGTQIQIDQDGKEVIAKIAGRRAGSELVKEYPDVAEHVNAACQDIVAQDEPDFISIATNRLTAIIMAAEIDDPLLVADISDILSMIKIEPGIEITPDQMAVIKAVAEGLISGIEIQTL